MTILIPATSEALVTPDDLLKLPDAVRYELVDGRLVERNMGMESSQIAARIIGLLSAFFRERPLGLLFGADASYQCFPNAETDVRKPDVSFIRLGRLPQDKAPLGHCRIPPDLAVEVLSPNDIQYETEEKVSDYLNAGVPLIWVVVPNTRKVRIHRPRDSALGAVSELSADDSIDGEDILPGFSCRIASFFG